MKNEPILVSPLALLNIFTLKIRLENLILLDISFSNTSIVNTNDYNFII